MSVLRTRSTRSKFKHDQRCFYDRRHGARLNLLRYNGLYVQYCNTISFEDPTQARFGTEIRLMAHFRRYHITSNLRRRRRKFISVEEGNFHNIC